MQETCTIKNKAVLLQRISIQYHKYYHKKVVKQVKNIQIVKPTPREFVRHWNQIHQALKKQLANDERISSPITILSLQYAPDMLQKVELVVSRFASDEDNSELVKDIRVSVCHQDEFINVVIESK